MIRRGIIAAILVLATLGSTPAAEPRDLLDSARQDLVELRFESALAALEALLGQPGMSAEERGEALVLRAQAHVAFGDLDAAENDYREILKIRASYVPDSSLTPRKAMARFDKVRAELIGHLGVELSPADARLSVDGQPVVLDAAGAMVILAGEYDLRAEREGFDPAEQHVVVEPGTESSVQLALVPNARTVILETEPDGVEVWLDGDVVGETARPDGLDHLPATLVLENLPLGDHRIELRKPCYRTERIDEYLTVDLLDQSPRRIDRVRLTPARSTLILEGGPDGADVQVDGEPIGRLPIDPYAVCPGRRVVVVSFAGRILWRVEPELRESTEITLPVAPRPNVVLLGADEWPAGLSEFGDAFNTLGVRPLGRGHDPEKIEDWRRVDFPSGTDLAVAVIRASREGARDRWFVYSPVLRIASVMDAAPSVRERLSWNTVVWGIETIDSVWGGNALVVHLRNGRIPEGLEIGDRILTVDGSAVDGRSSLRSLLAAAHEPRQVKLTWRKPSGVTAEGNLRGRLSPNLRIRQWDVAQDVVRAAWAVVDAASSGDRSPTALANLALLLSHYGHHRLAAETWQRVRWDDRPGVGEGTRQYYLGAELQRIGREKEAVEAFARAAESAATALDDEGYRVAPAARDRLADLGVRRD